MKTAKEIESMINEFEKLIEEKQKEYKGKNKPQEISDHKSAVEVLKWVLK